MSSATPAGKSIDGARRVDPRHDAMAPLSTAADTARSMDALQTSAGHQAVRRLLGRGAPLPEGIRAEMEARFGASFDDVRIHADPAAHALASAVDADALACAGDVVFGSGRFAPDSGEGRRLLAHELAHVVQQRRGGAAPRIEGGAFEASLEAGADHAADAAVAGSGPIVVAGASAPGVALSPASPERSAAAAERPAEREVALADGVVGWRQWLTQIESMRFDEGAGQWTITIDGERYALHEAQYRRNLNEANNVVGDRIGKLRQGTDAADRIDRGIRQIDQDGGLAHLSISWAIKRYYGITAPGDELTDAVRDARAHAFQAAQAQRDGDFVTAFEFVEAGRVPAERAARLATDYYDGVMAATQSMQDTLVASWADLLQLLLGVLKGIGSQATDLADTAFWATDELRNLSGGSTAGLLTVTMLAGPMGAVGAPVVSGLAAGHDTLKAMGVVDPSGRVSTTSAYSNTMEGASKGVTQAMGSTFAPDAILGPFDVGDLGGSLGVQALLAATGVKEVTIAADVAGGVSSLRTVVNTYRDNPEWLSDTNFWSGAIGAALSLVGLGHWSGTSKLVRYALESGQVATLILPIVQFSRDLANAEGLDEAENNRRLGEDLKQFVVAVAGVLQSSRARQGEGGPEGASPPGGPRGEGASTPAAIGKQVPAGSGTPALPEPTAAAAGAPLPNAALPPEVDRGSRRQVLPFELRPNRQAPSDPANGEGELHRLPTRESSAPRAPDEPQADARRVPASVEEEVPMQMAVGQTSGPSSIDVVPGPSLVYDAEAIVASTGSGDGDRPRSVPPPSRSGRVAGNSSGPTSVPKPTAGSTPVPPDTNGPTAGSSVGPDDVTELRIAPLRDEPDRGPGPGLRKRSVVDTWDPDPDAPASTTFVPEDSAGPAPVPSLTAGSSVWPDDVTELRVAPVRDEPDRGPGPGLRKRSVDDTWDSDSDAPASTTPVPDDSGASTPMSEPSASPSLVPVDTNGALVPDDPKGSGGGADEVTGPEHPRAPDPKSRPPYEDLGWPANAPRRGPIVDPATPEQLALDRGPGRLRYSDDPDWSDPSPGPGPRRPAPRFSPGSATRDGRLERVKYSEPSPVTPQNGPVVRDMSPDEVARRRRRIEEAQRPLPNVRRAPEIDEEPAASPADRTRVMGPEDRQELAEKEERAYWDQWYPKKSAESRKGAASRDPVHRGERLSLPGERTEFEWPTDLVDPLYAPQQPPHQEAAPLETADAFDRSDEQTEIIERRRSDTSDDLYDEPAVDSKPTVDLGGTPTEEARTVEVTDPALSFAEATTVVTTPPAIPVAGVPTVEPTQTTGPAPPGASTAPNEAEPRTGSQAVPPDEYERTRRLKRRRRPDR